MVSTPPNRGGNDDGVYEMSSIFVKRFLVEFPGMILCHVPLD